MDSAQVVVVGGGPAGYVCARRLGQLNVDTVLVEQGKLGGVCLNEGCIPTKTLFALTSVLGQAEVLAASGIDVSPHVDLDKLRGRTAEVVDALGQGVAKLLGSSGVEVVSGRGALAGEGKVRISGEGEARTLSAEAVVLATGSQPIELPGLPFDGQRVWTSWDALLLPRVPERLVVVGGGVIGLEMATVYRRLGSQIVIVEMTNELLPGFGLSRRGQALLRQALTRQGMAIKLGAAAEALTRGGVKVRTGEETEEIEGDAVLVAVGRRPHPDDLGLDTVGVEASKGFVATDASFQAAGGTYAIGDLRGGALLAHKASHEGLLLAEHLAGRPTDASALLIPQAVFTHPEVALVGRPVDEVAKEGGKVGRFPLAALGRAQAEGEPVGHFQVASDARGRLVGAEIVGPHASDLIAEATLAIQQGMDGEAVAATVHAHPTFPEGLWEAVLALLDRPLHTA